MLVLFGFIIILGLWFGLAPISSAIISPGIVQVASHRKTIQHFEGGIVDEILVRNGDIVTQDQPLVKLKSIYPAAEMAQLEGQQLESLAIVGRLLAVQNGATEIVLSPELAARADEPNVQSIIAGQQQILESFLQLQKERLSVFEQNIQQAEEEINGRRAQIEAKELQRKLLKEEFSLLEKLFDQDLMSRTRVLETHQDLAEVEGDIGEYQAEIARINKNVLETRLQINEMYAAQMHQVTQQLREERAKLFEISQRLTASRDVLSRTTIVSPVDGEVVNSQVYTTNGVIAPGQPIMDVVPVNDSLVVESRVRPEDIDVVRTGLEAQVRLTAYKRSNVPPVSGRVTHVSADQLTDPRNGEPYFASRVTVDADALAKIKGVKLQPGMPAEVMIVTGERRAIDYFIAPLWDRMRRAFREE
jgi:HlyD family type I secretion membrane fusion protein